MKTAAVVLCLMWSFRLQAEVKSLRGTVTYLAGEHVYTSLGRASGVQDSTVLYVVAGGDTTALLKVFGLSSKSSVCRVLRSVRRIVVGDEVRATVQVAEARQSVAEAKKQTPPSGGAERTSVYRQRPRVADDALLGVQGRIAAQYFTSLYENAAYNVAQPALVLSLRGAMRDMPLQFDVYANLRSLAVGKQSPFARGTINQSRIYGLSVTYDDGTTALSLGRIISPIAPSLGYIDGVSASTTFGFLVIGTAFGYQPDFALRGVSTDFKKITLFAQVASGEQMRFSLSTAYARTYYHSQLDREVASLLLNTSLARNLFLFGNVEADLRAKKQQQFVLSPRVTSAYANLTYRIAGSVTLGVGVSASRPFYSFQAIREIPDSLLADDLRSGVSVSLSWVLPAGLYVSNTYTPRTSPNASFGKEYSNMSAIGINDVLSTGISLRSNLHLHANPYTSAMGYGAALQRTFGQLFDLTIRFQRSGYTLRQTNRREHSTTLGADLLVFLGSSLTLMTTYDRLEGYGSRSHALFAEFGVRF